MTLLLKKFYSQESKGKCSDPTFEFGNLHRKEYECPFYDSKTKECHFCDKCDHREGEIANEGWRIN